MEILKFEPWPVSSFSTLFWKSLASKKLNEFKKGRSDIPIKAFYTQNPTRNSQLFFCPESFESDVTSVAELGSSFFEINGTLILCDTIEEFKELKRTVEAQKVAEQNLKAESALDLVYFVIFAFVNVKNFKFYHQIAFPVQVFNSTQITWKPSDFEANSTELFKKQAIHVDFEKKLVIFNDSSSVTNVPGWPLRQILVNLSQKFPGSEFSVISCRSHNLEFRFKVQLPEINSFSGLTGWETVPSDPTKLVPVKVTDISALIDPIQLAKQAGELNLKLMKWRLIPDLDLDVISKTSCLLVGSGTLGCNILRLLLGWGFRKISLIDSGKVSYSNPVRQSLFTFEDAKLGASKATAAAFRASQIDPNAQIEGHELLIPMPGHICLNPSEAVKAFETLNGLIQSHDVIFLLTDSRESRWLPALLGHLHEKIVITVGLGFDSFVVMRHGMRGSIQKSSCYFCHDVIGPTDSLSGRSLDQQCTVTRPGLSFIASSYAVELSVSLLQTDLQGDAPVNSHSRLGKIPHQIRGNLSNQETFTLSGTAFENCTCCSETILNEFEAKGFEFVEMACNSPNELERISGLTDLKQVAEKIEDFTFCDEDDF